MAKSKGGFYAVRKGRQPGVYLTWEECQNMVNGFRGAVFKKFATEAEAQDFINGTFTSANVSRGSAASASSSSPSSSTAGKKRSASEANLAQHNSSVGNSQTNLCSTSANRRRINVYCDGASSANGQARARAGWGVWFEDMQYQHLNEARRLPGPMQTNNRAELTAIWRACLLCPDPVAQLVIYTDSKYCVQAINDWQAGWRRRGWKLSSGDAVQNVDLIRRIERAFRARSLRPQLIHVAGHAGIHGNEMADKLAVEGASMPVAPASDELGELSDSDNEGHGSGSNKRSRY
ncbi:hypothetical protein OC844_000174 [Tilletia horrida]|nr:hypothetical protein OC844_000174 [Tilletia horrida]